jgi:replicative DNA helicase
LLFQIIYMENIKSGENNTFTEYLGVQFQQKFMWQFLIEPEFANKILPNLNVEYFDEPMMKRLFIIIREFVDEFGTIPNLVNKSIYQAVAMFKTPNNLIEEESLNTILKKIEMFNEMAINQPHLYDGDTVKKSSYLFIKQQEYRKMGETIVSMVKRGGMRKVDEISKLEENFQKITRIGDTEDDGEEVIENVENALKKEFRETIPTGIHVIDTVTGGGLGKGEIGIILTPSGVGKTTSLTKIANTAYENGKNVAQIVFEDTIPQVKRKHYTIWSGIPLSQLDDEYELATELVNEKIGKIKGNGRLVIKRMSQETTTMIDIRAWLESYQKKFGIKFDILILDYLDCVNSHKKTANLNDGEIIVIKSFEALAGDFNIPAWTAIQTNRSGFESEIIGAHHSGGSIKRIQKSHFFMTIQKTQEQKEANLANISIVKARFAKDGQFYKDAIFNNDTLEIRIEETYKNSNIMNKGLKKIDEYDVDKLNSRVASMFEENNKENILNDLKSQFIESENKTVINEDKLIPNKVINDGLIIKDDIPINNGLIIKDDVPIPVNDGLIVKDDVPINDGLIIKQEEIPFIEVIKEETPNSKELPVEDVEIPIVDVIKEEILVHVGLPIIQEETPVVEVIKDLDIQPEKQVIISESNIIDIESMFSNPDINHSEIMDFLKNKRNS